MFWTSFILWATCCQSLASAHAKILPPANGEEIFINNNGVTLHYRKYGCGPYLVLQHGFPDRETTFADFQVPAFAQSYTVLTPTLRGYPPSSVPPEAADYGPDYLVSDLAAILDHENTTTATVIGHDFGGAVVQYFSLYHPERVEAMVMMNTPPFATFVPLINFDKEAQEYARYTIPYYTYKPGQPKNISTLVENIRNTTYRAEIAAYLEASPIDGMLHYYSANYPGPPYEQNTSVSGYVQKVPSMLLWGVEDVYFSPKMLDGLEGFYNKGIRLVTVPGAGHWVFRDDWQRSNEEIWSFLKTVLRL
ncbi:putative hydrolase [Aaosphaeria arxii CBS 175.79]|uniref:Putative hydrolase n=1 Tax=Aaosphaeria arxii CBS 175.79 TaxID=1450172 RepID=A0A6A5XBB6_9PLEO|nr:putative hydrolase [Aaosphaeria arxii CBS 175.79]KAF2010262.1 putative hydrolase [Aaosphaeria arxii CBS 175.79]